MFNPQGKFAVYSRAEDGLALPALDVRKQVRAKNLIVLNNRIEVTSTAQTMVKGWADEGQNLDFNSWLPFCAQAYNISGNPQDYLLVPVIIMPSGLPNRNGVGFPLKELTQWNSQQGRLAYKTWIGKPVFYEHDNQDCTKAYGVIVDAYLKKMENFGDGKVWKVILLLAIDRNKHPEIARRIEEGTLNTYSMGAYVSGYTCSYCGSPIDKCQHISSRNKIDFYELDGKVVCRLIVGAEGFECSGVESPAFISAISNTILKFYS